MPPTPITYRPANDELLAKIRERAAEKGISVNEWLNRAVLHGLTKGGTITITTAVKAEI